MSLKDAINEIPKLVEMLKEKFNEKKVEKFVEAKLKDGSIIRYDGETPMPGMPVMVISEQGEMPLADGEYEMEDGTKIKVADGMIAEIIPVEAAPAETPQEMGEPETAMTESAVKRIVESIVKETVFSKEEIDVRIEAETKKIVDACIEENKSLKVELEKQKELLKGMFVLVEKIAEQPVEETKHNKKDGFKKPVYKTDEELSVESFRKKYIENI